MVQLCSLQCLKSAACACVACVRHRPIFHILKFSCSLPLAVSAPATPYWSGPNLTHYLALAEEQILMILILSARKYHSKVHKIQGCQQCALMELLKQPINNISCVIIVIHVAFMTTMLIISDLDWCRLLQMTLTRVTSHFPNLQVFYSPDRDIRCERCQCHNSFIFTTN